MQWIIEHFAQCADLTGRSSYKAMVTIFSQQCEVSEGKVVVKAKTGGDCVQNPSDLDASYDGHKGQGYQVQLAETCSPENEVQLITGALPQTAAEADGAAVVPMLDQLDESELLPEVMLADTLYCGDENVQAAETRGVELVGPIPGREPESDPAALTIDDFAIDERTGHVDACPAGHVPLVVERDQEAGTTRIEMPPEVCGGCPFRNACPINKTRDGRYTMEFSDKDHRLAGRRRNKNSGVYRAVRATLGDRVDQQRLEESAGFGSAEGARARECVPCDPAQSGRLERAAGCGVDEAVRLGEWPSGPDPKRRRIWADCGVSRADCAAVGRFANGFSRLARGSSLFCSLASRLSKNSAFSHRPSVGNVFCAISLGPERGLFWDRPSYDR